MNEHCRTKFKLLAVVNSLFGAEKVRFLKLINALNDFYDAYDKLRVEARVRPSPEKTQRVQEALERYQLLATDITLSLTLARILPDLV